MLKYCLKCKKDGKSVDSEVLKTKYGKTMVSSKCAACGNKNWWLLKKQEAKRLSSSLGNKASLSNIPLLGKKLFWIYWNNLIIISSMKWMK